MLQDWKYATLKRLVLDGFQMHDGWTVLPMVLFFLFTHGALLLAVVMCRHPCHAAISLANANVLCILISHKWLRSWRPVARNDLATPAMISLLWYYSHHALHVASSLLKKMFCTVTWQNSWPILLRTIIFVLGTSLVELITKHLDTACMRDNETGRSSKNPNQTCLLCRTTRSPH